MMKIIRLILLLSVFHIQACTRDKETNNLEKYLQSFNKNINDYKVICFVPVDGCGSCINPSLTYARDAREDYLLVMTSMFRKSIDNTIERVQIMNNNYISDPENIGQQKGLVTPFAPCYYFLRLGEVIKKYDLAQTGNKSEILNEVERFFVAEDRYMKELEDISGVNKKSKSN